ncbi:29 kDa IgE-binging protein [Candida maltosa Xu316]|uniref:D-lactate dehydratase n=1 Tax=Candida maltosa (strain Xu316) TaxID=1245528 RepID=M3JW62_CANMX|nr:29 kDa IgE-binging protein [Candida maltosa Xu316]
MVKVLLAVTSSDAIFYPDGSRTGVVATEALLPFEVFRKQGYEVQFSSETGTFAYDAHSLDPQFFNFENRQIFENPNSAYNIALRNIKKASDLNPDDYDIFFASAGHGTLFDYPHAKGLQSIIASVYGRGGVVGAVCRGAIIFENVLDLKTGEPLIKGKKITGFTDGGEKILGVYETRENNGLLSVRQVANKQGATYVEPEGPWDVFTVTDGRVVTGTNPQSSVKIAQDIVLAFETR